MVPKVGVRLCCGWQPDDRGVEPGEATLLTGPQILGTIWKGQASSLALPWSASNSVKAISRPPA